MIHRVLRRSESFIERKTDGKKLCVADEERERWNPRKAGEKAPPARLLRYYRRFGDAGEPEDALVTLDFSARTERFLEIVGKLHGGPAVGVVELADQAQRVEIHAAVGIAVAEIVGQQRAPARAEADAAAGRPLLFVHEVAGLAKIGGSISRMNFSGKMGVQAKNCVGVKPIRGDKKFLTRVAAAFFEPGNVFVAREKRILAVRALTGPVRHPIRSVVEELSGAESVGKQDEQFALIGLLPHFQQAVLRRLEFVAVSRHRRQGHGQLMRVCAYRLEVVLIGQIGIGSAAEGVA